MRSDQPRKSWTKRLGELLSQFSLPDARVAVELNDPEHYRGGQVTGSVLVQNTSSRDTETATHVTVVLYKFVPSGKSTSYTEIDRQEIQCNHTAKPHSEVPIPFTVSLPDDVTLTEPVGPGAHNKGCKLSIKVNFVKRFFYRSAEAEVVVCPHLEIVRIFELFEDLGFRPKMGFFGHLKQWTTETDTRVQREFHVPKSLNDHLDGMDAMLHIEDGMVEGLLTLDWTEHSVSEQVQALVGGNKSRIDVSWPRRSLNGKGSNDQRDTVKADIEKTIATAIDGRYGASATLLRPSDAPDDAASKLLRPSGASFTNDVDTLVRPADEPTLKE
jgi:sporulation-control protein spo0M